MVQMCYFVDIQLSNWPIYRNYVPLLAGGRNVDSIAYFLRFSLYENNVISKLFEVEMFRNCKDFCSENVVYIDIYDINYIK